MFLFLFFYLCLTEAGDSSLDPTVLDIKNQTAVPSGGLQGPQGWNFGVITTATEMGLSTRPTKNASYLYNQLRLLVSPCHIDTRET